MHCISQIQISRLGYSPPGIPGISRLSKIRQWAPPDLHTQFLVNDLSLPDAQFAESQGFALQCGLVEAAPHELLGLVQVGTMEDIRHCHTCTLVILSLMPTTLNGL